MKCTRATLYRKVASATCGSDARRRDVGCGGRRHAERGGSEADDAIDGDDRELHDRLARSDEAYVTALPGYEVELIFQAPPPPPPGFERTVLARTSGFYHIYVEQSGPPRLDVGERMLEEPLFTNRYMLSLFRGTDLDDGS